METVTLQPIHHRGQDCIGIYCGQNAGLNQYIKKDAGARWSNTQRCWWLPCDKKNYEVLVNALAGKALLQTDALKKFLQQKKNNPVHPAADRPAMTASQPAKKQVASPAKNMAVISKANREAAQQFKQQLVLKAYSPSTIRTYTNELMQFLQTIKSKPAKDFTTSRIKDYLQYCFEKGKLTENTLHSRINALKFYYEQVLGRERFFREIPRPKKQDQLPKVFNQDEIASIINSVQNRKHKVMLMLSYSGGLRVSEVVSVKTGDIDSMRMVILIRQAKGKKDRIVTLSPVLLVMLREYALAYKPDKKGYLLRAVCRAHPIAPGVCRR